MDKPTVGFNRTSVELKLASSNSIRSSIRRFNRTSVELKLEKIKALASMLYRFNRTSVELKRVSPACSGDR